MHEYFKTHTCNFIAPSKKKLITCSFSSNGVLVSRNLLKYVSQSGLTTDNLIWVWSVPSSCLCYQRAVRQVCFHQRAWHSPARKENGIVEMDEASAFQLYLQQVAINWSYINPLKYVWGRYSFHHITRHSSSQEDAELAMIHKPCVLQQDVVSSVKNTKDIARSMASLLHGKMCLLNWCRIQLQKPLNYKWASHYLCHVPTAHSSGVQLVHLYSSTSQCLGGHHVTTLG